MRLDFLWDNSADLESWYLGTRHIRLIGARVTGEQIPLQVLIASSVLKKYPERLEVQAHTSCLVETRGIQKFRKVSGQLREVWNWVAEAQPHDLVQGCVLVMAVVLGRKRQILGSGSTRSLISFPTLFQPEARLLAVLKRLLYFCPLKGHLEAFVLSICSSIISALCCQPRPTVLGLFSAYSFE